MFFRSADSLIISTGHPFWQDEFGLGTGDGVALPLGFEGPPAPSDDVPMPTGVSALVIRTSQDLKPGTFTPFVAAPILQDEAPIRRPRVVAPAAESQTFDGLPSLSLHALDAPAPMPRAARVPRVADEAPLPTLLKTDVDDSQLPEKLPPLGRQPAPDWAAPPYTAVAEFLPDQLPKLSLPPKAQRPEGWPPEAPLNPIASLPQDPVPMHAQSPTPQRPEGWVAEPILQSVAEFLPDQLPKLSLPPRPQRPEGWPPESPLNPVAEAPQDQPAPARAPAAARQPQADQVLPSLSAPPSLSAWFAPSDPPRPQSTRRQPVLEAHALDALPSLRAAPMDVPLMVRPPRRPPPIFQEALLEAIRAALPDDVPRRAPASRRPPIVGDPVLLPLTVGLREALPDDQPRRQATRAPRAPDEQLGQLGPLATVLADVLIVPRGHAPPRLPDPEVLERIVSAALEDAEVPARAPVRAAVVPFEAGLPALRLALLLEDEAAIPPRQLTSVVQRIVRDVEALGDVAAIPLPVAMVGTLPTEAIGAALATLVSGTFGETGIFEGTESTSTTGNVIYPTDTDGEE